MNPWIVFPATTLLAMALSSPIALAQTLRAVSTVDVANTEYNGENHVLALAWDSMEHEFTADSSVSVSSADFTGLDSSGITRTMTYSGTSSSSAEFRWGSTPALRVRADGRLINSFYNADNPPYFDATIDPPIINTDGVPDRLETYGNASFTEILHWSGTASNYLARYKFRIHGNVTHNAGGFAMLLIQTMGEMDYWILPTNHQGPIDLIWTSRGFPAGLGFPQSITVTFALAFDARTQEVPEGGTVEGDYHFGSTITLDEILVTDEHGNPVDDWAVEAASGSNYETGTSIHVFEDGFETQDAARSASHSTEAGPCRPLVEGLATLPASRSTTHRPAVACAPAEG